MASAVDGFIKGPIEIIGWAVPESGAKDFLQGIAKGVGDISYALEGLSPNPRVFKVAKIGTDIAGLFVGAKGLVTAVTKAGKAVKLGQAAESLKYVVSGGAAALARDVVFVAEGTALAGEVAKGTASLLLASSSSKTFHDDVIGGSAGGESKLKTPAKVNNMYEFFETEFGQMLEGKSRKTSHIQGDCAVYEVTQKTGHPNIDRGDLFYLDKTHGDHLEIFDAQGRAKAVLNLDGSLNLGKTTEAVGKCRTIKK
jgi:hypothetical protein